MVLVDLDRSGAIRLTASGSVRTLRAKAERLGKQVIGIWTF